ncbi:MAG TPA: hypothetical protein PKB14_25475 [Rubrivivax sp.]|nr:hypothetical protein [Rubrivivax sp.]
MTWEPICTHGDSEDQVRTALRAEFDARWTSVAQSVRRQLMEQGASMHVALDVAEQLRVLFRQELEDRAPQIIDNMAATAATLQ